MVLVAAAGFKGYIAVTGGYGDETEAESEYGEAGTESTGEREAEIGPYEDKRRREAERKG
jgi:hypothetical protein